MEDFTSDSQTWAYPTISKAFYDPLTHKIGTKCLVTALDGAAAINLTLLFRSSGAIIVNSGPLLPSTSSTILALFNNRKHHRQGDTAERHEGLRRQGHAMRPDGRRSILQRQSNGAAHLVGRNANCLPLHVDAKRVESHGTTPRTQPLVGSNFLPRAFSRALHKVAI